MGMHIYLTDGMLLHFIDLSRLLNEPFDYTLAFNQALKNVVDALPNLPPKESREDVVSKPNAQKSETMLTRTSRCTTVHSPAVLVNIAAILVHFVLHISITWSH